MGSKNGTCLKSLVGEARYPFTFITHAMLRTSQQLGRMCVELAHTVLISSCLAGPLTRKGADIPPLKQTMDPLAKLASSFQGEKGVELQLRCNGEAH